MFRLTELDIGTWLNSLFSLAGIKAAITAVLMFMYNAVGGDGSIIDSLITLLVVDAILGFVSAPKRGEKRQPRSMFRWVKKVALMWVCIFCIKEADAAGTFATSLYTVEMWKITVWWLCACELLSICRHLDALGLHVPQQVIDFASHLKDNINFVWFKKNNSALSEKKDYWRREEHQNTSPGSGKTREDDLDVDEDLED